MLSSTTKSSLFIFATFIVAAMSSEEATRLPLETFAPDHIDYFFPTDAPTTAPKETKRPRPIVSDYDVPPGRSLRGATINDRATA